MGALKLITAGAFGAMPEKPSALLDVALRNVDRVVLMINDLLDLEKLDAGKMEITLEPTDLSAVIEEAVAANTSYAEELGVSFRCSGTERPRMIDGNHARMIQVLNNLLSNAAKFSRPGGVVEVELRDRADGLQVLVKDTGVGIPKEAHARLFERFAQAGAPVHAGRRGSGLGLSIAKAIVEHHGGAIRFTSEVGVGTTFWIDLPKQSVLLGAA
jgi:signal transduction histidine kinase